ncbi:hypothetical protein T492DRAFT_501029 [Pavlovales sp. CCMP2436]|nr:hypothetical protein T492DRAFT_501029 [Pavlovales sp. CCMP2436]
MEWAQSCQGAGCALMRSRRPTRLAQMAAGGARGRMGMVDSGSRARRPGLERRRVRRPGRTAVRCEEVSPACPMIIERSAAAGCYLPLSAVTIRAGLGLLAPSPCSPVARARHCDRAARGGLVRGALGIERLEDVRLNCAWRGGWRVALDHRPYNNRIRSGSAVCAFTHRRDRAETPIS